MNSIPSAGPARKPDSPRKPYASVRCPLERA
jgi:hypothetical protein